MGRQGRTETTHRFGTVGANLVFARTRKWGMPPDERPGEHKVRPYAPPLAVGRRSRLGWSLALPPP